MAALIMASGTALISVSQQTGSAPGHSASRGTTSRSLSNSYGRRLKMPAAIAVADSDVFGERASLLLRVKQEAAAVAGESCSRKQRGRCTTMSLPEARWSARALKTFSLGELEARKLKYPTTGTEALLMGLLTEGTSNAAKLLRSNGIMLFGLREETVKLLGKADMYFFSPEHPPLTEPALKALQWAIEDHAAAGGVGEVTAEQLLLGIWLQQGSAGRQLLETMGFTEGLAEELRKIIEEERNAALSVA